MSLTSGKLRIYITSDNKRYTTPPSPTLPAPQSPTQEWHMLKTLQLTRPATCMVYIQAKEELWIACESKIVMVNDRTEMVEYHVDIKHALNFVVHPKKPKIKSIVHNEGCVWVLLHRSSIILEYDAEMGILTHVINCDELNPLGMVISRYITMHDRPLPVQEELRPSSESGKSLDSEELETWIEDTEYESDSQSDSENNVPGDKTSSFSPGKDSAASEARASRIKDRRSKGKSNILPELPPKVGKPPSGLSQPRSTPPNPPPRKSALLRQNKEEPTENQTSSRGIDVGHGIKQPSAIPEKKTLDAPPLPPKISTREHSKSVPGLESSIQRKSDPIEPPPVPPERAKNKSKTLPLTPSPSLGSDFQANTVNSIICVGDSLWLGRSCGDIVIVNIKSNSSPGFEHGRVIAHMKPEPSECETAVQETHEVVSLMLLGCLVICLTCSDSSHSEISAWEAYSGQNIQQIQSYWSVRPDQKASHDSQCEALVTDLGVI